MIAKEKMKEKTPFEGFENMPPIEAVVEEERMKKDTEKDIKKTQKEAEKASWEDMFTAKLTYLLETKVFDKLRKIGVIDERDIPAYRLLGWLAGEKIAALGNIQRSEIWRHLTSFDITAIELKVEGYKLRRSITTIMRENLEMWLTRSVGALERKAQITTRTEQEMTQQLGMAKGAEGKPWWKIW